MKCVNCQSKLGMNDFINDYTREIKVLDCRIKSIKEYRNRLIENREEILKQSKGENK